MAHPDWQIGVNCGVQFESLFLLELRRVSPGSWQPVLAYCPADDCTPCLNTAISSDQGPDQLTMSVE